MIYAIIALLIAGVCQEVRLWVLERSLRDLRKSYIATTKNLCESISEHTKSLAYMRGQRGRNN